MNGQRVPEQAYKNISNHLQIQLLSLSVTADIAYKNIEEGVVFVTGRGGAGFHFVTPLLLRPGVNSLPFLPAPYDKGPWPGCGAGRVFYFPR